MRTFQWPHEAVAEMVDSAIEAVTDGVPRLPYGVVYDATSRTSQDVSRITDAMGRIVVERIAQGLPATVDAVPLR